MEQHRETFDATTHSAAFSVGGLMVIILAIAAAYFWSSRQLIFATDDYLILDKLHYVSFWKLWVPHELLSEYYRPWSREFHYWLLTLGGTHAWLFHLVNAMLWVAVMSLALALGTGLVGSGPAVLAVALLATNAAWGALLVWAAGAQDLWMLTAGLAFLLLIQRRRYLLAIPALIVSLLSKESAAILPLLAFVYCWFVANDHRRNTLLWCGAFVLIVLPWAAIHPHIGGHYHPWGWQPQSALPVWLGSLGTLVSVPFVPHPASGWGQVLITALPVAAALSAVTLIAIRQSPRAVRPPAIRWFLVAWTCAAWLLILAPGLRWHPYYSLWGAIPAYFLLASYLRRWPYVAAVLIAACSALSVAQRVTPQLDQGSEWYQRHVATVTRTIHDSLMDLQPHLAHGARCFFAQMPSGVSIIAGPGYAPALKLWYADTTLRGYFYSQYAADMSSPHNYFFVAESTGTLREVVKGAPHQASGPPDAIWRLDHAQLATLFYRAGDIEGSCLEWRTLANAFPNDATLVHNAAVCDRLFTK